MPVPAPAEGPGLHLTLTRDTAELARLAGEVERFLERHPRLLPAANAVQLALEELVSNVIRHADARGARLRIDVHVAPGADGVRIAIEDDGQAFDPLAHGAPDVDAPLDERTVGGLGIHLVRNIATDLAYARRDGRNRLELLIPLPD